MEQKHARIEGVERLDVGTITLVSPEPYRSGYIHGNLPLQGDVFIEDVQNITNH